jgi:hypothetical protein
MREKDDEGFANVGDFQREIMRVVPRQCAGDGGNGPRTAVAFVQGIHYSYRARR